MLIAISIKHVLIVMLDLHFQIKANAIDGMFRGGFEWNTVNKQHFESAIHIIVIK